MLFVVPTPWLCIFSVEQVPILFIMYCKGSCREEHFIEAGHFFFYFCLICLSFCKNLISLDPLKLVVFIFKANES